MSTTADLKRWLELDDERKALQKRLEEITSERDRLGQQVLSGWLEDGQTSIKLNGRTVYVREQQFAHVLDRTRVVEVLKEAGLEGMLTPNSNSLSAWVRERVEAGEPLPEAFEGVIGVFERHSLATRRS